MLLGGVFGVGIKELWILNVRPWCSSKVAADAGLSSETTLLWRNDLFRLLFLTCVWWYMEGSIVLLY